MQSVNCSINGKFHYLFALLKPNFGTSAVHSVTVSFPNSLPPSMPSVQSLTQPVSISANSALSSLCLGIPLCWDVSSFFLTYPFALHDVSSTYRPGYCIVRINLTGVAWIVANTCSGFSIDGNPCVHCASVDVHVDVIHHHATAESGYPYRERSSVQLIAALNKSAESEKKHQLQVCRLS